MSYDRFLIAPIQSGQQTNVKPWLIMDDAFQQLRNMYVWRGRITKRFGSRVMNESVDDEFQQLFSRLRLVIGTTDGAGDFSGVVDGAIFAVGQLFSVGDNTYSVFSSAPNPTNLLASGIGIGTYDLVTGQLDITGSDLNTDVYFYPAQPVMGLTNYLLVDSSEQLIGFDTQFAYKYDSITGWSSFTVGPLFHGDDLNFFWSTNYRLLDANDLTIFTTNNFPVDGFWYYDGTNWTRLGDVNTTQTNIAGDFVETCLLLEPFQNRLVLFNTSENVSTTSTRFINRIRWAQTGSPISAIAPSEAWRDDIAGRGGFLDIPVSQAITSVGFIKDRLIIYMELSTWELVFTGNNDAPFIVQQINSELGVDATHSTVVFDKSLLGFGNTGVHECSSINVDRIDDLIPETIFDVAGNDGAALRTHGIRDYFTEQVYWSYNSESRQELTESIYPNRVLVYDYKNKTWAYNDDSITCLGYFRTTLSTTWQDISTTWQSMDNTWHDVSIKANFRAIIAGNQQGFTFILDSKLNENANVNSITNITTNGQNAVISSINNNLAQGDFVSFNNIQDAIGNIGDTLNEDIAIRSFRVDSTLDKDTFVVQTGVNLNGDYSGLGTYQLVSYPEILTKQYNFYNKVGQNISLSKVSFLVDSTVDGQFSVEFYSSTSDIPMFENSLDSGASFGTNIVQTSPYPLYPLEQTQDRFWHSIYFNTFGECVQLKIYLSDDQMIDIDNNSCEIEINAIMFYVSKANFYLGG